MIGRQKFIHQYCITTDRSQDLCRMRGNKLRCRCQLSPVAGRRISARFEAALVGAVSYRLCRPVRFGTDITSAFIASVSLSLLTSFLSASVFRIGFT